MMKRNELISIIQNELTNNPQVTCIDIAIKHKIPLCIVELLKRDISNGQKA